MDRRRIAVLTDLDLAEHYLEKGDAEKALLHAYVALENALRERERSGKTSWDAVVSRAFLVKSRVLQHRSS